MTPVNDSASLVVIKTRRKVRVQRFCIFAGLIFALVLAIAPKHAIAIEEKIDPESSELVEKLTTRAHDIARRYEEQQNYIEAAAILKRAIKILEKKRARFGGRSERLDPDQLKLALEEIDQEVSHAEAEIEKRAAARGRAAKPRAGERPSLPAHPPRIEAVIPSEDTSYLSRLSTLHMELARLYSLQNRYSESEDAYKRALALFNRDDVSLYVGSALDGLAGIYEEQGRYTKAEGVLKRLITICEKADNDSCLLGATYGRLATIYMSQNRDREAEDIYKRAVAVFEQRSDIAEYELPNALTKLAELYVKQRKYAEAEEPLKQALKYQIMIFQKASRKKENRLRSAFNGLAALYILQKQYRKAEDSYKDAIDLIKREVGDNSPELLLLFVSLANINEGQGHYGETVKWLQRAVDFQYRALGLEPPRFEADQSRQGDSEPVSDPFGIGAVTGIGRTIDAVVGAIVTSVDALDASLDALSAALDLPGIIPKKITGGSAPRGERKPPLERLVGLYAKLDREYEARRLEQHRLAALKLHLASLERTLGDSTVNEQDRELLIDAMIETAQAHRNLHLYGDAVQLYERALSISGLQRDRLLQLAELYEQIGRPKDAEVILRRSLNEKGGSSDLILISSLVRLYVQQGEGRNAERLLQQLIKDRKTSDRHLMEIYLPWLQLCLGEVYELAARLSEAENTYNEGFRSLGTDGVSELYRTAYLVRLLRLYRSQKQSEQVKRILDRLLSQTDIFRRVEALASRTTEQDLRKAISAGRFTPNLLSIWAALLIQDNPFIELLISA